MKPLSISIGAPALACISLTFALGACASAPTIADAPAVSWKTAGEILARVKAPQFSAHDFAITDYGAVAGGAQDCSAAIAKAIAACNAAGGGRVVVPAGDWLTGAIHLKSNVDLHVA